MLVIAGLVVAGPAGSGAAAAAEPEVGGGPPAECPAHLTRAAEPGVPTEAEAVALAGACGKPVEVTSARDFSGRTWAQPEGSLSTTLYAVPQWARDPAGQWAPVDTSLVRRADGSIRAAVTVSDVWLSGGGEGPFVTLTDPDGGELSLSWPDPLPAPSLAGDTATYRDVLPDVDLSVTAGVDGFSYGLVVRSAEAAANPALARVEVGIAGAGLTVSQTADGRLAAHDRSGNRVFTSLPGVMWDSSGAGRTGSAPDALGGLAAGDAPPGRIAQTAVELEGDTLAVVPDAAMLSDPETVFPVVIDPPFTGSRMAWANVHREQPGRGWTDSSSWPRAGGLRVGLCTWTTPEHCGDAWGLWRAVMEFNTGPLAGKHILSAAVKMTQTHTGGCGTYPLRLYKVSDFSSGVSWNGVNWGNWLQTRNVPSSNDGCGSGNQPVTFNNSNVRSWVQLHADRGFTDMGVGLRSGNEGTRDQWRRIRYSQESLRLEVEHASYPKTPTRLSTDGKGCATSGPGPWLTTGRPTLSGWPRNGDGTGRYYLQVRRTGSSTNVYTHRSGVITVNRTVSKRISSGSTLSNGSYRWRMRSESWNSSVPDSPFSAWCNFRVDTTPPPEPSATLLTAEPTFGSPVEFRLDGTGAARFRYNLTGGSNTTVDAVGGSATITINPPTTSIDHELRVWALDAAGNLSARHDLWFVAGKGLSKPPVAGVWRFDGDWRDDSGHGHTLTPGPGAAPAADRVGRPDAAMGLTGESCAATAGPVLDTATSYTVAAWARPDGDGSSRLTVLSQGGENNTALRIRLEPNNRWGIVLTGSDVDPPDWYAVHAPAEVTTGSWQHIAGVYDAAAAKLRIYVDGVLRTVGAAPVPAWQGTGAMHLGCAADAGGTWDYYEGAIDDVVAHQGVLTSAQIRDLMDGQTPAGQMSWWPLRGDGADAGPGGNELTVPPAASWVPDSFGRAGSAMQLDGTGCAATDGPVVRTDDSFTVAAWARPDDAGDSAVTVVSLAGQETTSLRLRRATDSRWGVVVMDADVATPDWFAAYAPVVATTGGWQHLTGVYDAAASEIRLYIDGVERASRDVPVDLWRGTGGLHVGCAANAASTWDNFTGAVHDVRAWRGAATPEQVRATATKRVSFWGLDGNGADPWSGNHLSLMGDYEWVEDRFGWPSTAFGLSLDGSGWAETAGPVVTTDESFTVSAWARLDDKSGYRAVVSQAGNDEVSFKLSYNPAYDRWQFAMPSRDSRSDPSWRFVRAVEAPVAGQWYHLAGVFDLGAGQVSLYINGELQGTAAGPGQPWHVDGELLVGSVGDTSGARWDPMVGAVDMVRAYSGVLDAARIADQGVPPTSGTLAAGFDAVQQDGFDTTVAQVPVQLAEPVDNPVTVEYESTTPGGSGYAVSPEDFEAVSGTVTFQPGETVQTVSVTVHGDPDQGEDLLAVVEFSDPTNAALSGDGTGGVWIMAGPGSGPTRAIDTPSSGEQWHAGEQITFEVYSG